MNLEKSTPELFAALAKSQCEVENATKGSVNPHFRNRYADLAEVLNTVRPVISANGLSISQDTSYDGNLVSVTTAICHTSGGYITSTASCVPAKSDAQGIGSATTYLRRYSIAAMAGIAQEDDDGNAAAHNKQPEKPVTNDDRNGIMERVEVLGIDEDQFLKYLGIKEWHQLATQALLKKAAMVLNKKEAQQ
jgi:hypothetical protein